MTERKLFCSLPFRVNVPVKPSGIFGSKNPVANAKPGSGLLPLPAVYPAAWALAPGALSQEGEENFSPNPVLGGLGVPLGVPFLTSLTRQPTLAS